MQTSTATRLKRGVALAATVAALMSSALPAHAQELVGGVDVEGKMQEMACGMLGGTYDMLTRECMGARFGG